METIFRGTPIFVNGIETSDFPDKITLLYYRFNNREWLQWKSRKTDASIIASKSLDAPKFVLTFTANGKIRTLSCKTRRANDKRERLRAFPLADFEIEQVLALLGLKARISWAGRTDPAEKASFAI